MKEPKSRDLMVWWIPQVPMKAFEVNVSTVEEGVKIMEVLADYDHFQFKNHVKPDYSNSGGMLIWEDDSDGDGNPGWVDFYDEETGIDNPVDYLKFVREERRKKCQE